ncbi:MAG: DDE transposase family protein [Cyanobacteria bacterium J06614_10]
MEEKESWYIVKQASGQCAICSNKKLEEQKNIDSEDAQADSAAVEQWGPFETQNQAIAKRVGLIRTGKCQPS